MSRRPCLFNCKSEGPPGPIWCRMCGHDPKCCTCDDLDDLIQPPGVITVNPSGDRILEAIRSEVREG